MFWEIMCPASEFEELGANSALFKKINKDFGSLTEMQKIFEEEAKNKFGSGWAWIVVDGGGLSVMTTSNQDSPKSHKLEKSRRVF
jgi:Fe-Mn family superoxide dismutase